ncbi:hypothetical protein TNCV_838951 [Trichonephila clavipes]|nr:hypothetical protein TNCV_838951 [Trichonephila clavipes]
MNLPTWLSNSPELLNSSLSSDVEHSFSTDIDLSVKTLGISWSHLKIVSRLRDLQMHLKRPTGSRLPTVFLHNGAAKVSILASNIACCTNPRLFPYPRPRAVPRVLLAQLVKKNTAPP